MKEAIKRVKKEGLKASASIVKKEKMRYRLVLILVFLSPSGDLGIGLV